MSATMRIYGLDFTSAPSSGSCTAKSIKRLMLAVCTLKKNLLQVDKFELLNGPSRGDFSKFEAWLRTKGEWIAGLDFPFGQPAQLIDELNWAGTWAGYVGSVCDLRKNCFEKLMEQYKNEKPVGQKELRRKTDCIAGAVSPMKLYGVPVGKMFFQGAGRLLRSKLSIHPVRTVNSEKRHVIEAYPKLVVRKCLNKPAPYKSDDPPKQTQLALKKSREQIVQAICAEHDSDNQFNRTYGIRVAMCPRDKDACINDPSGDHLDSVLCAIQAAWSYSQRDSNYGIPGKASIVEGWICDPQTREGIVQ